MNESNTALLLIGFQNDYFHPEGILNGVFEDKGQLDTAVTSLRELLATFMQKDMLVVSTPIQFTEGYTELDEPIGILQIIKENGAFKQGSWGACSIDAIADYGEQIRTLPGKRGLNCFSNTDVGELLQSRGIEHVVIAGAVTSLCIDTAGREALDLGYKVTMLSDAILARTPFEQSYYLEQIMPLYSRVTSSAELISDLR
ncbi:MAG: cysteine hydrolase family protein [Pseudomonadales bacterium]